MHAGNRPGLKRGQRGHADQLRTIVRGFLVRVLDFHIEKNLKRGQENRGLLFSTGPRVRVVRVVRVLDLAAGTVACVQTLLLSPSNSSTIVKSARRLLVLRFE